MKVIRIKDIPISPKNHSGWPWTEDSSSSPKCIEDNLACPKISIITPSFNQGQFIEETIRSVLLQGYPNLEYIIIDGGSTDESIEIIKKYEPWLSYWESNSDKGQSHAINKGFKKATGEIYGWLNSDDYFLPNALKILMNFRQRNINAIAWVGACIEIDKHGQPIERYPARLGSKADFGDWWYGAHYYQPSCLFSAKAFHSVGGLNENLHYVMDIDLWLKMLDIGEFAATDDDISHARKYSEIKTLENLALREAEKIAVNYNNKLPKVAERTLLRYSEAFQQKASRFDLLDNHYPYLVKFFFKNTLKKGRKFLEKFMSKSG